MMKINLGKLLHIAVTVAPKVVPLIGLAQVAVQTGKAAAKDHEKLSTSDLITAASTLLAKD